MLNILFPDFDWNLIKCAGFDLDGTLYDEFDFISQVFINIIENENIDNIQTVVDAMKLRWIEKGSSYPFIFKEIKEIFNLSSNFEETSLLIFRNFKPTLSINQRIKFILDNLIKENKICFLLTNGHSILQNNKIEALKIKNYFKTIIIAENNQKPHSYFGYEIMKKFKLDPKEIIYFGDKEHDKSFAYNCGFSFKKISHDLLIKEFC